MKNRTKIMMMVISTLLALVMISSCLVSSTMAKYVITKTATTEVGFKKFGVTVAIDSDMTKGTEVVNNDSTKLYSVTVPYTVTLTPSDTVVKNITASITGTPSVNTKVTIDVAVSYVGTDAFKIKEAGDFYGIDAGTIYVPLGIKAGNNKGTSTYTVNPYNSNTAAQTEEAIEQAIANAYDMLSYDSTNKNVVGTLTLDTSDPTKNVLNLTNIGISLDWPKTSSVENSNEIGTYISRSSPKFKIEYTITVEQN